MQCKNIIHSFFQKWAKASDGETSTLINSEDCEALRNALGGLVLENA